jgi:hypothetical protein
MNLLSFRAFILNLNQLQKNEFWLFSNKACSKSQTKTKHRSTEFNQPKDDKHSIH